MKVKYVDYGGREGYGVVGRAGRSLVVRQGSDRVRQRLGRWRPSRAVRGVNSVWSLEVPPSLATLVAGACVYRRSDCTG